MVPMGVAPPFWLSVGRSWRSALQPVTVSSEPSTIAVANMCRRPCIIVLNPEQSLSIIRPT